MLISDQLAVAVELEGVVDAAGGRATSPSSYQLPAVQIGAATRTAGLESLRLRELYRRPTVRAVKKLAAKA